MREKKTAQAAAFVRSALVITTDSVTAVVVVLSFNSSHEVQKLLAENRLNRLVCTDYTFDIYICT